LKRCQICREREFTGRFDGDSFGRVKGICRDCARAASWISAFGQALKVF
jgi:hypothetical protein